MGGGHHGPSAETDFRLWPAQKLHNWYTAHRAFAAQRAFLFFFSFVLSARGGAVLTPAPAAFRGYWDWSYELSRSTRAAKRRTILTAVAVAFTAAVTMWQVTHTDVRFFFLRARNFLSPRLAAAFSFLPPL